MQHARKGEFSRQKVKGKRAIELGAGMGLGGLAMAMLGRAPTLVIGCVMYAALSPRQLPVFGQVDMGLS